jgi:N-acetylglucosamine kinase-like BadF-type ATPase
MSAPLFLGVDGGGSKTHFVLVDGNGRVAAAQEGPSSYHLEIGLDGLRGVLDDGLAALFRRAGIGGSAVTHAFFGLPAYGEDSAAQPLLDAMPEPLIGHRRYRCGNDMVCAFAGSLGGEDGINIVAGTGSIVYGERAGQSARAGGWGEIFGDEGSAYWIAVQGLNTFTRMSDGRLPRGPLYEALRASLALDDDLDLCAKVMNAHDRGRIAAMAPLVAAAAQEGDAAANQIFRNAADELADTVGAVRQALKFAPDDGVPVSYSGGVFNAGPLILAPLQRRLEEQRYPYRLTAPMFTPVAGAAIYAAKLAKKPLFDTALRHLTTLLRP